MDTTQRIWFIVLFTALPVWFALVARLFRLLREGYCEVCDSLGAPSFFLNTSIKNNW